MEDVQLERGWKASPPAKATLTLNKHAGAIFFGGCRATRFGGDDMGKVESSLSSPGMFL